MRAFPDGDVVGSNEPLHDRLVGLPSHARWLFGIAVVSGITSQPPAKVAHSSAETNRAAGIAPVGLFSTLLCPFVHSFTSSRLAAAYCIVLSASGVSNQQEQDIHVLGSDKKLEGSPWVCLRSRRRCRRAAITGPA